MNTENIFENMPDICRVEIFETLVENSHLKIERIISEGHSTPPNKWYNQDWDEWVILLQGSAGILFEGDAASSSLKPGDYLFIPAHRKHRVEWTDQKEKTIWLAVHVKMRNEMDNWDRKGDRK